MDDNWAALTVAIILGVPPETAFEMVDKGKSNISTNIIGKLFDDRDVEDMIKLKSKCTLGEIGYMYGLTDATVCRRIKKYNREVN